MRKCVFLVVIGLLAAWSPTAVAAQDPKEPDPEKVRPLLLETVGLLATSQVYQGYLNVGLIADGKATGAYSEKDARQILDSVVALMEASDKNLEKMSKLELTREDRAGLNKLRRLNGLVRRQALILQDFWTNGNMDYSASYERLRKEAWGDISKLLKLN